MVSLAKTISSSLLHLFFPHICQGCYDVLPDRSHQLCVQCLTRLPFTYFDLHENNPVEKTFYGRAKLTAATSLLYFTPSSLTQELVHRFKYKGQQNLAKYMGRLMGFSLAPSPRFQGINLILPLPLFKNREKSRGYNQSNLLSQGISEVLHLPVVSQAITRQAATKTQTHKSREERWANVQGQFRLKAPEMLTGQSILIVDDVITTGATIDACASLVNSIQVQVYISPV